MGSLTEFEYFSDANDVRIAGCWTAWVPESMSKVDGSRWTYSTPLTPGAAVQFKFIVDGVWMAASHYDFTDDGHGAKNNTRCVDQLCTHDERHSPTVHEHVDGDEHPADLPSTSPLQKTTRSLNATVAGEKESAETLARSTDAVSDISHVSPDAGIGTSTEKLTSMAMTTSQSTDTSTRLQPVQETPKLVKLLSDCISDQEDSEQRENAKEETQEDFEVEDESEAEENVAEKVQNLKLEEAENKKQISDDTVKKEDNNCIIV